MRKQSLVLLAVLLLLLPGIKAFAESRPERWTLHLAYHDGTLNCPTGYGVFALMNGNLMQYDAEDESVRLFSKMDGLNGRNIRFVHFSEQADVLVLVYDDGLIDLYYPSDQSVVNMPQVKNGIASGVVVNGLFVDGTQAVLALSDGIAHLDLQKQEVKGYYVLGENVTAAAIYNEQLMAVAGTKMWTCALQSNPLDLNSWITATTSPMRQFTVFGGQLYAVAPDGLYRWTDGTAQRIRQGAFLGMYANDRYAVGYAEKQILLFSAATPDAPETFTLDAPWQCVTAGSNGVLWASGSEGLQAFEVKNTALERRGTTIGGYGPRRDLCYYMNYVDNRLLVAGGRLDPYDREHYAGTIMLCDGNDWVAFQEDSISTQTGVPYRDITCIVQDPKDANHHYASAGGTGVYEFRNLKFVRHISNHNSPLVSAAGENPRYVRIDGLQYDAEGNLWMLNNQADTLIRVLKADGTWKGIYLESVDKAPTCERTLMDSKGRFWVTSRRTVSYHDGGLLCLDYNGTVDNTKDDVSRYRTTVTNQDGTSYSLGGVYCLVEDVDGAIWIGSKAGLFVIANPDEWNNEQFRITQIKVPRNDGTNLADYLLSEVSVMAIAIDGAGRKWIGTQENGLYLVSHDGTEVLAHFDVTNSPILSNNIYSIAINHVSGEVMIGTDKGLCSYSGQATAPETTLDTDQLKVYPNPVRPEHHQGVTLTGLTTDAEVKVVSAAGHVVAAGVSAGGTFVWDACGLDGSRVKAGVYYFLISTADGKKGATAKVVVI